MTLDWTHELVLPPTTDPTLWRMRAVAEGVALCHPEHPPIICRWRHRENGKTDTAKDL